MAGETISRFFERIGFKLRNDRNSWGATNSQGAVMLRSWDDETRPSPRRVRVFVNEARPGRPQRASRNERKDHLRGIWAGGIPAYTVIITPKFDRKTGERKIGAFRDDAVFPIQQLVSEDGSIYAVYGAPVPIGKLAEHMQTYKLESTPGPLAPALADASEELPTDPAARSALLAADVREYLIDAASRKKTVLYGELFDAFDLNHLSVAHPLSRVGRVCVANGEPILTALVVEKTTGRCSTGMDREFGVDEDEERLRVFEHWGSKTAEPEVRAHADWTDEELRASVAVYKEMMQLDAAGTPYVKVNYYRQLAERFGRDEGGYSRRMQNISYLLDQRGLAWLQGLKPQENVGPKVEPRLTAFLEELSAELTPPLTFPEDVTDLQGVIEGAKKQIMVNAYERDSQAKLRCVKRWGCVCVVCDFDFHAVYGQLGKGFIHVHHLKPIHTIGEAYILSPEDDLRPVCPNCHSMLHRKKEVISIEELATQLKRRFDTGFKEIALSIKTQHEGIEE